MKATALMILTILICLVSIFTSCTSRSGQKQPDSLITLRGMNLQSGIISPISIRQSKMVYKVNDIVWVDVETGMIAPLVTTELKYASSLKAYKPYKILIR